jgi:hypothetical protein
MYLCSKRQENHSSVHFNGLNCPATGLKIRCRRLAPSGHGQFTQLVNAPLMCKVESETLGIQVHKKNQGALLL